MKIWVNIIGTVAVIASIGAMFFAVRAFSNAVTVVDVIEVEPGVRCAKMVTGDGAAISCWKVD